MRIHDPLGAGWYEDGRGAVRGALAKKRASTVGQEIARLRKRKAEALSPHDATLFPDLVKARTRPSWSLDDEKRMAELLTMAREMARSEKDAIQEEVG